MALMMAEPPADVTPEVTPAKDADPAAEAPEVPAATGQEDHWPSSSSDSSAPSEPAGKKRKCLDSDEEYDDGRSEGADSPKACSGWEHDISFVDMLPQEFDVGGMCKRTKILALFKSPPAKDAAYIRVGIHGTSQAARECRRELVNLGALDVGRDPFAPGPGQLHIPLFRDMHGQWLNFVLPLPLIERVSKRHDEIENAFCIKMRTRKNLPTKNLGVVFMQGCLRDVVNAKRRIVCLCHLPVLKVNPMVADEWQEHPGVTIVDTGPPSPVHRAHFLSAPVPVDDAASDSSYEAPLNRKPLVLRPRPASSPVEEEPKRDEPNEPVAKRQHSRRKRDASRHRSRKRVRSRDRVRSRRRSRSRDRDRERKRSRKRSRDRGERERDRERGSIAVRSKRANATATATRRTSPEASKWPRGQAVEDAPRTRSRRRKRDLRHRSASHEDVRTGMRAFTKDSASPRRQSVILSPRRRRKADREDYIDSEPELQERGRSLSSELLPRKGKKLKAKKQKKKREFSDSDLHSPEPVVVRNKKKKKKVPKEDFESPAPKRRKVPPTDENVVKLRKKKSKKAAANATEGVATTTRSKRDKINAIAYREIERARLREEEEADAKKPRKKLPPREQSGDERRATRGKHRKAEKRQS